MKETYARYVGQSEEPDQSNMLCCVELSVTVLSNIPQVIHLNHFVLSLEKVGFSLRHLCLSGAFKAARHDYLGLLDS